MDLRQTKLTKNEWDALEVPVQKDELKILKMIYSGYEDLNIVYNDTYSLMSFIKIGHDIDKFQTHFYKKYFEKKFSAIHKKRGLKYPLLVFSSNKNVVIKKADEIRIKNSEKKLENVQDELFEFVIINLLSKMFKYKNKSAYYYFTIIQIMKNNIHLFNPLVEQQVRHILSHETQNIKKNHFIKKAYDYIEKNTYLLQFANYTLYDHQKQLFWLCKQPGPKIINYIAPTGTGKTLSPLGLSKSNKVIFTCAAKHVGMQLAKCAISLHIPIAIAFGCKDPGDIRLHYFAAKDYTRHRKTGQIFRVDNSVGDKVEMIICDIQSYQSAMNYMLAFNNPEECIWYWDEPTITMDYDEHEFHDIMIRNWEKNVIPNVILSSATLPKHSEIAPCITNITIKFPINTAPEKWSGGGEGKRTNYDVDGRKVLPHYVYGDYKRLKKCFKHISVNKTILRHFDFREICKFIIYVNEKKLVPERYLIEQYFPEIADIDVLGIKLYYLELLKKIKKSYESVYTHFQKSWTSTWKSTVKISTEDAWTLTDGPTIFLADNIRKIALIFLRSAKIPGDIMDKLLNAIYTNTDLKNQLIEMEKREEDRKSSQGKSEEFYARASVSKNTAESQALRAYEKAVAEVKNKMYKIQLDDEYIPNSRLHQKKWKPNVPEDINPYCSNIDEETVEKIMMLDIDNVWKILLMMGIGVFVEHECVDYSEIMKKMATEQNLYLILASTDYIYGTNYQFCHGYLSKDLTNITQEKMIQAFGRVGRSNAQRVHSLRVRSNELFEKLLMPSEEKPEVANMNRMFGGEFA